MKIDRKTRCRLTFAAVCLSIVCLGAAPPTPASKPPPLGENATVRADVASTPAGATVHYTAFGKTRTIGTTPFSWTFLASDIVRSSMIPTLTFELAGYETLTMPLSTDPKVKVTLRIKRDKK